jgi:hypothetical protein
MTMIELENKLESLWEQYNECDENSWEGLNLWDKIGHLTNLLAAMN